MFDKIDAYFLSAAMASFVFSVTVWFLVDHSYGSYIGIWVPSILALWVGTRIRLFENAQNAVKE